MGQTLTYGVYLPDEGERNCYSGLAQNWQILDNAVGAIADKASASHTHGNITNDGAIGSTSGLPVITGTDGVLTTGTFGTASGTFCEGNDSRLSDARTPVAHTHGKSDITDLFNTANTWTGANSFYKSVQIHGGRNAYIMPEFGASYSGLAFGTVEFKQSFKFGDWVDNDSTIGLNTSKAYVEIYAGLDSSDNVNKARINPANTTESSLGTSANQWKSVYSQTYYYNGTQWGLDQANVWTNIQRMTCNPAVWYLRNTTVTLGTAPASNRYLGMFFEDVNGANLGYAAFQANRNGYNSIVFNITNSDGTNTYTGGFRCTASPAGAYSLFPEVDGCDLALSTNKWKTFNGINPGALSLPSTSSTDIKPYITSGTAYDYIAPLDGWVCVGATNCTNVSLQNRSKTYFRQRVANSSALDAVFLCIPCQAGDTVRIEVTGTIDSARFHPCLGNV